MDINLIKDLEFCAERLMKDHLHEANIVLAVIGLLQRTHRNRVEDIENGILKDLEKYHMATLNNINKLRLTPETD